MALKVENSTKDEEDDLGSVEWKDKENEMDLLSKKLWRILNGKRNKEDRIIVP